MAGRNYERLDIETFGAHLLKSGDLDPIYIALRKTFDTDVPAMKRWMVAYWCFYHAGQACYISEADGPAFWDRFRACAKNTELSPIGERWQRGHERRHFRGEIAGKATRMLAGRYLHSPADLVNDIVLDRPETIGGGICRATGIAPDYIPFCLIAERAQELPLFGPWISFKIGDMIDRCLGIPVDFDNDAVFMFKDPTEAALKLWRLKAGLNESAQPKEPAKAIQQVVDYLTDHFSDHLAPPLSDRPVGLQEIETILCKWKSHMNGHYPLNNDILEIRTGLQPWLAHSESATLFLENMPELLTA